MTATLFDSSFSDQQILGHDLPVGPAAMGYSEVLPDDSGTVRQQPEPAWWSQAALDLFIGVADFYPAYSSPSAWAWQSPTDPLDIATAPLSPMASPATAAAPFGFAFDAVPNESSLQRPDLQLYSMTSTCGATTANESNKTKSHEESEYVVASVGRLPPPSSGLGQPPRATKSLPALTGGPDITIEPYPLHFSLPSTTPATREKLENCLRLPLMQNLWTHMSIAQFPSGPQLDYLVDLYFANFDMLLPMIHRPTFDSGTYPILTLSMCAIGVLYSGFDNAHGFSKALCELLRRLFVCLSEQNAIVTRSYEFLAAQTLQSVLSNSSSGRRLFEFGDNNRSFVVASARAAGLPHLSLAEMNVDMPSSTSHWEAESWRAWASLQPWTNGAPPRDAPFRETLDRLVARHSNTNPGLSGSPNPSATANPRMGTESEETEEFHLILMATTLLRTVWNYRHRMQSQQCPAPMPELFTPSVSAHDMDTALSLLTSLATSTPLQSIARASGVESRDAGVQSFHGLRGLHEERHYFGLVHRTRISLVAQIIAADQVSSHLDAEWHRGAASGDGHAREVATERLRAWGEAHPLETRRMARIGAQLLAISRLYPYHMPREPYDAFRAGLLLWTMAPLIRAAARAASSQAPSGRAATPRQVCQLDWLGDHDTPEGTTLQNWIDHGGHCFVLRMHEIPDICTRQGSRQILVSTSKVLQKLHVWGASEVYRDIVLRALREDQRAHRGENSAVGT
ncbi:C2H2 type zinc finger domain [Cordyceps militaris]|uniref:C2H2 type zinc finger domain n=1 Tax=Cordyceps militaris TaxID=73501 RepID=A0A2H4SPC3_CORMI|nr:C2H2 type zinc finger domain [Cordyceps militaris]